MHALVSKTIEVARGEVDTRETLDKNGHGTNRGARVDQYQRADTLPGVGYSWCASFVAFCILEATRVLGAPDKVWNGSASCDVVLAWARDLGILKTSPQPGDVFLRMARLSGGRISQHDAVHTGFVTSVSGSYFGTVEGNSNNTGSREGIAVVQLRRPLDGLYLFVRWGALCEKVAPAKNAPPAAIKTDVFELFYSGEKVADMPVFGSRAYAPVREVARVLGAEFDYIKRDNVCVWNGREVPSQVRLIGETGHVPIDVLESMGVVLLVRDVKSKRVDVTKAGAR